MRTPVTYGVVGVGGALGGVLRYALSLALPDEPGTFPWTTLGINVVGSFLLGFLVAGVVGRRAAPAWVRPALGTGLLGGFTTFSAVSHGLDVLVSGGRGGIATAYLVVSLVGAGTGALLGLAVGSRLPARLPADDESDALGAAAPAPPIATDGAPGGHRA